jgi:hypothetical protein
VTDVILLAFALGVVFGGVCTALAFAFLARNPDQAPTP